MFKNRRVFSYILSEIAPSFIMGVFIFICVLLMFQALRLTEFMLVHGIRYTSILRIMGYMSISFLPMLMPMSLLFAILLSYNRLSMDSEIIALKASGVNPSSILLPSLFFAALVAVASSQTTYYLAPWGNRQFEVLINRLGSTKAAASIKEGTFSEGFFDLVVYANKVNSNSGQLYDIFIYDEKNPKVPVTILAQEGQIIPDSTHPGHSVLLRLFKGQIHRRSESHTVVNFDSFDVYLRDPIQFEEKKKTSSSLNFNELQVLRNSNTIPKDQRHEYDIEYHKRSALSFACIVFCIIGLGFGIVTNRRSGKSSGFVLSVGFIILYWILYLSFESLVRSNTLPITWLGLWLPNIIFLIIGLNKLRQNWN
jgi:lipopolysaccharide export system permease protein